MVVRAKIPANRAILRSRARCCGLGDAIGAPGFEPGTSPTRITRSDAHLTANSLQIKGFGFRGRDAWRPDFMGIWGV